MYAKRWAVMTIFLAVCTLGAVQGCGEEERPEPVPRDEMKTRQPVAEVIKENAERLMKIEGVVGVYEGRTGTGEPGIIVMVKSDNPGLRKEIPPALGGYPVTLEIGGEIRPMR